MAKRARYADRLPPIPTLRRRGDGVKGQGRPPDPKGGTLSDCVFERQEVEMEADPRAPVCESAEIVVSGPGNIKSEILECDRPRSIGWKGRALGISALHVWRMRAQDGSTHVATEESWSGPLARLLPGLMSKTVRKALDDGLPALKAEAELRASSTP